MVRYVVRHGQPRELRAPGYRTGPRRRRSLLSLRHRVERGVTMGETAPADAPTFAPVPIIDPDAFERFEGLRETTLALFTDAKVNSTLRAFVDFVYTIALEYSRYWPKEPGGSFRHEC